MTTAPSGARTGATTQCRLGNTTWTARTSASRWTAPRSTIWTPATASPTRRGASADVRVATGARPVDPPRRARRPLHWAHIEFNLLIRILYGFRLRALSRIASGASRTTRKEFDDQDNCAAHRCDARPVCPGRPSGGSHRPPFRSTAGRGGPAARHGRRDAPRPAPDRRSTHRPARGRGRRGVGRPTAARAPRHRVRRLVAGDGRPAHGRRHRRLRGRRGARRGSPAQVRPSDAHEPDIDAYGPGPEGRRSTARGRRPRLVRGRRRQPGGGAGGTGTGTHRPSVRARRRPRRRARSLRACARRAAPDVRHPRRRPVRHQRQRTLLRRLRRGRRIRHRRALRSRRQPHPRLQ